MPIYPTKEEILAEPEVVFSDKILGTMNEFKKVWQQNKNMSDTDRFYIIYSLLRRLNRSFFGDNDIQVCYNPELTTASYNWLTHTIMLKDLSIISALHEFGHKIVGNDELGACRFSVHLFRKTFPKAFEKLHWEGHQLKK